MDINAIAQEVAKVATTVQQVNTIVADIQAGRKKLAIVPASGPSFVISKPGSELAMGISATPILVLFGVLLYAVSTRKRRA